MAINLNDEVLPPELINSVQELNSSIDKVDKILDQIITNQFADNIDKLELLDQAKAYLVVTYAMNSLYWMYLNTQGISPKDHPVKQELDRIRTYMNKVQALYDKRKAKNRYALLAMKVDKKAAGLIIKSALKQPIKKDEADNTKSSRKLEKVRKAAANKKRKIDHSTS
ncbi:Nuclear nucleic acid-binding protein C1D [Trichoplax sp. H2]|nr:Nuclear nucleic acid-binding protein C1D [Trichoplax sp. H2]|eukprot:RDD40729.1 Nuclear nucleic acid-binding protein C1D [Trichoplax sp. H2]